MQDEVQFIKLLIPLIRKRVTIKPPYEYQEPVYTYDVFDASRYPLAYRCILAKNPQLSDIIHISDDDLFYTMQILVTHKAKWSIKNILDHLLHINSPVMKNVYIGLAYIGDIIDMNKFEKYLSICNAFYHKFVLTSVMELTHDMNILRFCINNGADIEPAFLNALKMSNHAKMRIIMDSSSPQRGKVVNQALLTYISYRPISRPFVLQTVRILINYGMNISPGCIDVYAALKICHRRNAKIITEFFLQLVKDRLHFACDEVVDDIILIWLKRYCRAS